MNHDHDAIMLIFDIYIRLKTTKENNINKTKSNHISNMLSYYHRLIIVYFISMQNVSYERYIF